MARGLLRRAGSHAAVSNLELFFDLVYVFAITQISQFMRAHLGLAGLVEAALLFLAMWWAWIYTSWATNWANPETVPVRLMLIATMLASLIMATVLPHAFDGNRQALVFAGAYCALQLGRTLFMVWAMAHENPSGSRNLLRIFCWFGYATPLWLAGALVASREAQVMLWAVALAIEYAGPFAFFRVPGLGRSTAGDWAISGSHMAERAALFVLIALGEGIVVTGAAFAERAPDGPRVLALLACFAGSVLMWWIYFDTGAERGARHITQSADVGRVARNAYTYMHLPIVASVVASAVADALLMAAPEAVASPAQIAATAGGLIGFLGGLSLFKRFFSLRGLLPLSHVVGLVLLTGLIVLTRFITMSAVGFSAWCSAVLLVVAVWEWGSFHGGWRERWLRWRNASAS
ncbi:low temperature requirement protein A [Novosphingobium sp.]|uniref:low temperature requirement protein A n=1 Tax=Novosphingobium sp. TaxID=1874826 RepID=UPI00334246B3